MSELSSQQEPGAGRGILLGLRPLALLLAILLVTLLLDMLIRMLDVAAGFFVQQNIALTTAIVGFGAAIVVYIIAIVRTLKHVETWQQEGATKPARLALWSLGITALVMVLPVLVAIVLPQHPAP